MTKAHELAKKQREISIAEFFEKNRHLLGFDNRRKALLTTIKEAVDNSLDACEDAKVLPDINVEINQLSEFKYNIIVEDNGPGILKSQIPKVFAKLLYGSKFFKLSQSRGQQGIGISAAVLYAQLTTGKPAKIISRISPKEPAHYYELYIDVKNNAPKILKEEVVNWKKEHGTKIELNFEADYLKGLQSVDEYIKQTAIINPHITLTYTNPKAEQFVYSRASEQLPPHPKEIQPHPYGIEIGLLMRMIDATKARTLQSFLMTEFSRVGAGTAKEICENASLLPSMKPREIGREQAEKIIQGISKTKIITPPTDCISPIGGELLEKGLKKEIEAEFYCSISRPASVYRGNPFVVEVAMAYGGKLTAEGPVTLMRFANRVPLLYQQGSCITAESLTETNWKPYGLQQSGNSMPTGPAVIVVHMASVWVPFTSEAKEAIAHYPEIEKEVKLALQECGRKMGIYVNRKVRVHQQLERANLFERYIPEIADSLASLTKANKENLTKQLKNMLNKEEIRAQLEIGSPEGKNGEKKQ
ncbi:DNA topoisomerase VI subunit B [Candidatus Woesearchaeota archaeon]|nr:DNA topoisomerase VI subunit B [Candidatus Woesearchaeota archaeon]|tara:strand:+ start:30453 stop:32042 length:1590 start_codon:yes stop_codon:yes gene_type:complete